MKIHEYQGKEILRKFGVAVPRGKPVFSVDDAVKAAEELGGPVWVVKAQIHAGGRGKGGGVKVAKSLEQVREFSNQILGMQLVTHQTGPEGQKVNRLLIEEGADIKKELYVGLVRDELHAEDLVRIFANLFQRLCNLHAAALTTAASVNLSLDDPNRAAQLLRGLDRIVHREHGLAARDRDAELPQDFLSLVLVNLHA
jgi:phosphoribosylaminoimidazole carboxylase (NCAIR synthetase)